MRMGMVIDLEKCIGCRSCTVACKQHNAEPPGIWWNRVFTPGSDHHMISTEFGTEYFLPVSCQQCDNPACEKVCPVGATYLDKDGVVLIDFERCIGCRYCMNACPYGVRQFNWESSKKAHEKVEYVEKYTYGYPKDHRKEERLVYTPNRPKGVVEKCTFCVQYMDDKIEPACVRGCPGKARTMGDLDDPDSVASTLIRNKQGFTLLPEKGTKPKVFYLPPKRKEI